MPKQQEKTLRLILGDQLNIQHSWFSNKQDHVIYVMMEIRQETDYAKHHIQKIVSFFLAMREFKIELERQGHQVYYFKIDQKENQHALHSNLNFLIKTKKITRFEYLLPDEYRLDEQLKKICGELSISTGFADTEHFYTDRSELSNFFSGKSNFRLENFYRYMRKKHSILMEKNGKDPLNGQWNFDELNRKKLPKNHVVEKSLSFKNPYGTLIKELQTAGVKSIGNIVEEFIQWPITRQQSLELLDFFTDNKLFAFGTYQDAMSKKQFELYHSLLSFSLNTKLISPKEVIDRVIEKWESNNKAIEYNQVEGFVRQILGWREYMRGIYWSQMPEYQTKNYFNHKNKLPVWYWTGSTKMQCLSHSIKQSLNTSYAHHIQRLMVTGNFALLAGIDPDEVDQWYLGIYIDAIEWVEITNTRGMSQYADGGLLASKPYISSGSYINKMSDYCEGCFYKVSHKTEEDACPFNSLYWNFIDQHKDKLSQNQRMSMIYSVWNKFKPNEKEAILNRADFLLNNIEKL